MIPSSPTSAGPPRLSRTQARVIWSVIAAALVAAVVGALAAAALVPSAPSAQVGTIFTLVAAVMVPADLAVSYVVTSRMRRRPAPGAPPDAIAGTQVIVGSAVAFGAAAMCCVFFFFSRQPLLLLLVLPCAAVLLHWFPSRARWARWTALPPPAAPGAPRRSEMMRE